MWKFLGFYFFGIVDKGFLRLNEIGLLNKQYIMFLLVFGIFDEVFLKK